MTRAETLARQDALRAVLTGAGWRRKTVQGTEFWQPPDYEHAPWMSFLDALRQSAAARKHPYFKSAVRVLEQEHIREECEESARFSEAVKKDIDNLPDCRPAAFLKDIQALYALSGWEAMDRAEDLAKKWPGKVVVAGIDDDSFMNCSLVFVLGPRDGYSLHQFIQYKPNPPALHLHPCHVRNLQEAVGQLWAGQHLNFDGDPRRG